MDKWGRRMGILFCSILSIIGGIGCCAAQNPAMFIVFRFFVGFGANAFVPVTGVYTSELAPPALRGFFGGLNGILILVGYSLAAYMGLAFFHAKNPAIQWRAPLGLALIFPVLMLLVLPFLPESPRWLLLQSKPDEAERIVQKLHQRGSDDEFVRNEFYQMRTQAEHDKNMVSTWKEIFVQPSYRKRVFIAMLIGVFGQASGIIVINNFSPLIYQALGFDVEQTLILLCGWISGGIFAATLGT
jgi:MFS family permease